MAGACSVPVSSTCGTTTRAVPRPEPPSIPEDDDPSFHRPVPRRGTRKGRQFLHPQFVAENFPDMVHMQSVHKWLDIPEPEFMDFEGPVARNAFEGTATPRWAGHRAERGHVVRPRVYIARITGIVGSCTIGAFTPIHDRSSMAFVTVWVPKGSPDETEPKGSARR